MVRVDIAAQPIYRRQADFQTVVLPLAGEPDAIWEALFKAKAKMPDSPICELCTDDNGHAAAAISTPRTVSNKDVGSWIQKLVEFVDEVETEHAERTTTLQRLEEDTRAEREHPSTE